MLCITQQRQLQRDGGGRIKKLTQKCLITLAEGVIYSLSSSLYGDVKSPSFWLPLVIKAKPPADAGGHMKPGKIILNISFEVDEYKRHLGLGLVSKMALLDSLGLVALSSVNQT